MKNPTKRTPGQQRLLQGIRTHENKDMGDIIKESSIDDLEWFLLILDAQLQEPPEWPIDQHKEMQAWQRRARTMTTEILHNKRVAARPGYLLGKVAAGVGWIIVGAVIGYYVNEFLK